MPLSKKNLVHCQLIINNLIMSVVYLCTLKINLPIDAAPWNFYCSWGTHPTVCMSNFIQIDPLEVGFSSINSFKNEKNTIFEKNIFSGVNFITALLRRNSYFQEHPIFDMVFCLSRMFFIFSFFHFLYEFKIYGSTSNTDFLLKKSFTANNCCLQLQNLQILSIHSTLKPKTVDFTAQLKI